MDGIYWFAVGGGIVALLYGIYAIRSVLASSSGNERMQEIAGAIQEGARAYLNSQQDHAHGRSKSLDPLVEIQRHRNQNRKQSAEARSEL